MEKNFNLQKFIMSVVLVGIVLVMGIYITSEIGEVSMNVNAQGAVINETVESLDYGDGDYLDASTLKDVVCSVTSVLNSTDGVELTLTTDYTVDNCLIESVDGGGFLGFDVKVSYTYTYTASTSASNASENVTSALATGTSWISILVVVGFAVIILTMLTSGLGSAATNTAETPYY